MLYLKISIRNLLKRKIRTFLTLFGVILGVAVILAIDTSSQSTVKSYEKLIETVSGKINMEITNNSPSGFNQSYLKKVKNTPGVKNAVGSISKYTFILKKDKRIPFLVMGVDPLNDNKLRHYSFNKGKNLRQNSNGILLTAEFASDNGLKLNNSIELLLSNQTKKVKIIGLLNKVGAGRAENGVVGFVTLKNSQKFFNLDNNVQKIEAEVDPAKFNSVKKQLENKLGSSFNIERPASRSKETESILKSVKTGLNFFSLIAIFVGAYLIFNTFLMSITERSKQFSTLRMTGATRRQVITLIMTEALVIAIVGLTIGCYLGKYLAAVVMSSMSGSAHSYLGEVIITKSSLLKTIIIGFLVSMMSAFYPAIIASKVSLTSEASSNKSRENGFLAKHGWIAGIASLSVGFILSYYPVVNKNRLVMLEISAFFILVGITLVLPKLIRPLASLIGFPLKMLFGNNAFLAIRNLKRDKVRSALTAAALMIGIVMAVAIQITTISYQKTIDDWVKSALNIDVFVRPNIAMGTQIDKTVTMPLSLEKEIKKIKGVDIVAPVRFLSTKASGIQVTIIASTENVKNIVNDKFLEGSKNSAYRDINSQRAALISTPLRESLKVHKGDYITIKTAKGPRKYKVAAVLIDFTSSTGTVYIGWQNLVRDFGESNVDSFDIEVKKGYSTSKVKKELTSKIGKKYGLQILTSKAIQKVARDEVDRTFNLMNGLVLISIIVAFFGLINTLIMNIAERVKEIGVLRALGAYRSQISKIVIVESIIIGTTGALVGLVGGAFTSKFMVEASRADSGYPIQYVFSIYPFIYAFVFSVFISVLAAIYPVKEATAIKLSKAISYE